MYIILRSYQLLCPGIAPLVFLFLGLVIAPKISSPRWKGFIVQAGHTSHSAVQSWDSKSLCFKWCPSSTRWLAFSQACSTNSISSPDSLYIGFLWCLNHGQSNSIHSAFCEIPFFTMIFRGEITSGTFSQRALGAVQMTWALTLGVWEALGIELPSGKSSINGGFYGFWYEN